MLSCRFFAGVTLLLAAWLGLSAAFAFVLPAGRAFAVVGGDAVRAVVDAGGLLLHAKGVVAVARSNDPEFVRKLYAAGALLVIDADGVGGCSGRTRGS